MNDRKVAGAIYALKDCHMCNLDPQIGAFPQVCWDLSSWLQMISEIVEEENNSKVDPQMR